MSAAEPPPAGSAFSGLASQLRNTVAPPDVLSPLQRVSPPLPDSSSLQRSSREFAEGPSSSLHRLSRGFSERSNSRRGSADGSLSASQNSLEIGLALDMFAGRVDPADMPDIPDEPFMNTIPEYGPPLEHSEMENLKTLSSRLRLSSPAVSLDPLSTGSNIQNSNGSAALGETDSDDGTTPRGERILRKLSSIKDAKVSDNWALASAYLKSSWQYQKTGRAAAAAALSEFGAENIPTGGPAGIRAHAATLIRSQELDDTFYVYDLGNVTRMFKAWRAEIPRVTPFYAVKCNPDPGILKLLVGLGAGFDCASKMELETVLQLKVPNHRIIFAHPCKRPHDIDYAAANQVDFTTFDTLNELEKIKTHNPRFKCVLRIRADDPDARVHLGLKYGADPEDAPELLQRALDLGLSVVGVSFHVGSGSKSTVAFRDAIVTARHIFDIAELMGFHMELLDIGGGFTGHFDADGYVELGEVAATINRVLEEEFPPEQGVRVIAEPGRYFAETSATLFSPIYGKRDRRGVNKETGEAELKKDYWITDGTYGSFNCIVYDDAILNYEILRSPVLPDPGEVDTFKSTVWGPTCDSADCMYRDIQLPELRIGDWMSFPNAGAYTVAGACDFNGINMTRPSRFYVYSDSAVDCGGGEDCVLAGEQDD